MKMPTDFDDFSPAAVMTYRGRDPLITRNLNLLHWAMARGGFLGMRTEWWHFIGKKWRSCKLVQVDSLLPGKNGRWPASPAPSAGGIQSAPGSPSTGIPPSQPRKR
jgi:hypothetical protein